MPLNNYEKESYLMPHGRDWWSVHPNIVLLRKHANLLQGKVCDVGCNNGMCTSFLFDINPKLERVVGVDVNPTAIERARVLAESLGFQDRLTFHRANILDLPFEDGTFKCVICMHTLEHVYKVDLLPAVKEMHRVLSCGGNIIIAVPLEKHHWDPTHVTLFDVDRLKNLFMGYGFEVENCSVDNGTAVAGIISGIFTKKE